MTVYILSWELIFTLSKYWNVLERVTSKEREFKDVNLTQEKNIIFLILSILHH